MAFSRYTRQFTMHAAHKNDKEHRHNKGDSPSILEGHDFRRSYTLKWDILNAIRSGICHGEY